MYRGEHSEHNKIRIQQFSKSEGAWGGFGWLF